MPSLTSGPGSGNALCQNVPMTTTRAYGGVPAADRRAERRTRLVDAALTVLTESGTSSLSVHRVCRAARLNERYFYESFGDRDELLAAVAEASGALVVQALVGAMATAEDDPRAQATAAIGAGVDLLVADPRLAALMQESAADPVLAHMRRELTGALVTLITERALATLHLPETDQVHTDAVFAATMLLGGLVEALTAWTGGRLALTRDELVGRCVEMFLLVGDHAAAGNDGRAGD